MVGVTPPPSQPEGIGYIKLFRFGSVLLGCVYFGLVRYGLARLGLVWFGFCMSRFPDVESHVVSGRKPGKQDGAGVYPELKRKHRKHFKVVFYKYPESS